MGLVFSPVLEKRALCGSVRGLFWGQRAKGAKRWNQALKAILGAYPGALWEGVILSLQEGKDRGYV